LPAENDDGRDVYDVFGDEDGCPHEDLQYRVIESS